MPPIWQPTNRRRRPGPAGVPSPATVGPPKLAKGVNLRMQLQERRGKEDIGVALVDGFALEWSGDRSGRRIDQALLVTALSACRRPRGAPVDLSRVKSGTVLD